MQNLRNKALFFLLPAYLVILAAAFIPHHHHFSSNFCTNRVEEHDLLHVILVDCINPHCEDHHSDHEGNNCDNSSCIAKVVYLASHFANDKHDDGLHPILVQIPADLCELSQHEYLFTTTPSALADTPYDAALHNRLFAASCGLRAPPALA